MLELLKGVGADENGWILHIRSHGATLKFTTEYQGHISETQSYFLKNLFSLGGKKDVKLGTKQSATQHMRGSVFEFICQI